MASTPPADDTPVVLVTGASSGIGRAIAHEFAARGDVRLVLVARREQALDETMRTAPAPRAGATPATWELLVADLGDPADVDRVIADVRATGRLDVLVNNAGVSTTVPLEAPDGLEQVDRLLDLNLRAPMALVHGCFHLLAERRGAIVNVSSVAGLVGTPGSPIYSATKWGLTGFTEAIRARYAYLGIRVCCMQPGPVPTEGFPHERLRRRSRLLQRLLASDSETIARDVVRFARGGGSVSIVRPRTYAFIPLLRGVAPWSIRRLLRSGRVAHATSASSSVPTGTAQP
jgi:NAD(P)-dependent dehydrogenase (short-subunit alcohol dehydrogenase family)